MRVVLFHENPRNSPSIKVLAIFQFSDLILKKKLVRCIQWYSNNNLQGCRPRSLVDPGTPCVLIRVCEIWWERSHCLTWKHCRVGNYLCFLKIKDLNSRIDNYRYYFGVKTFSLLPLREISRGNIPQRKISISVLLIEFGFRVKFNYQFYRVLN